MFGEVMKLEDVKAPEGFKVKGFKYPKEGEYVLLPTGKAVRVGFHDHAFKCGGIILEKIGEPEVGKYYEFSDDQNFCEDSSEIKKLHSVRDIDSLEISKYIDMDRYIDDTGESWRFIRPVEGEFGK